MLTMRLHAGLCHVEALLGFSIRCASIVCFHIKHMDLGYTNAGKSQCVLPGHGNCDKFEKSWHFASNMRRKLWESMTTILSVAVPMSTLHPEQNLSPCRCQFGSRQRLAFFGQVWFHTITSQLQAVTTGQQNAAFSQSTLSINWVLKSFFRYHIYQDRVVASLWCSMVVISTY